MISTSSAVKQAKDQVSCDLAGEAAVLNLKNGVYYGLNPIGARIWNLIEEPKIVRDLRDAIVAEYEVQPDACERDLLALLADLEKNELIEVTPSP